MQVDRGSRWIENTLIGVAAAALISVVLANVIRVKLSPEAAIATRAVLFGAGWIAAIAWALAARHRSVLVWLCALAGCAALIALCQAFAGGVSGLSLLYVVGPGGAGVGVALLIQRCLAAKPAWTAWGAAFFGAIAAVWLAFEPEMELWKLLPNDWEVSKGLEYRWGIRMGQERARFLFDTPMEAGVVQWVLGALCLATAMKNGASPLSRGLLGSVALLLVASVALTYSRAGLVLGALSAGLALLMSIRSPRATIIACISAGILIAIAAVSVNRFAGGGHRPAVANIASILSPTEEANRIRLSQLTKAGATLRETPWHGRGPSSFATFKVVPRMPEHESSPVGLIYSFGLGGLALVLAIGWQIARRTGVILDVVLKKELVEKSAFGRFVVLSVLPFTCYTVVAPVFSGIAFGMLCFAVIGLLAIWKPPLKEDSGKP